jgi:hypothetical protein
MEFGWGLMIGILSGTNIGFVMAGLLAGAKRSEASTGYREDQLHLEEAVWEDATLKIPRVSRPLPAGTPDPAAHL